MVEKRRHRRQTFKEGSALVAKLILSGGSLIEKSSSTSIEIGATPLDISQGGIGLTLKLDVPWETLTPSKIVSLLLSSGPQSWLLEALVVRHERDHRTLGLQFVEPLSSIAPFLAPVELH